MDYSELNMHPDLARGVAEAGYVTCMPVQAAVFPHAFVGDDIYAQSQTGTGKTAAFLISIFQRIMTDPASRTRKVLILAPTRELAVQIEDETKKLGKYLPISIGSFYGGVSYGPQLDKLRDDVQMLIGTPGRIIDLVQQGKMMLREVGFLVVDEADRMFDMGFIDDLRKLLRYLPGPKERQTFLFSATLNFRIKNLAWEYMDEPKEILIEAENVTVDLVTQELYHDGADEKFRLLLGILARDKPASALIFCNQKFMAEEIARRLGINGYSCEYIMGDLPQSKRLQVIDALKAGKLSLLVATDVAARGLDVNALDMVINYDLPMDPESYVHRIGRTARAGAAGKAISMACEKFVYGLPAIEKYIETKIPVMPVTEELFGVDKSAGMRFGHARERGRPGDERGERRPVRTAGRDSRSRDGRDGRGRDAGRDSGRPAESRNRGPAAGPRSQEARPAERRPAESRGTPPGATGAKHGRPADGNPYAVSAEERMRRYKEKYATGAAPGSAAGSNAAGTAPGVAGAASGAGRGPRDGQNAGGQGRSQGRQREGAQGDKARQGDWTGDGRRDSGRGAQGGRGPQDGRGSQGQSRQAAGNGGRQGNQQGTRPAGQGGRQGAQGGRANGQGNRVNPGAAASSQTSGGAKKPGILDKLRSLFGKKKPE
ncbi:MAG: DEAD/DEAH box helicase [Spirochaetia bacterium]|jgi:ATP-dependent RNA helicase RhlB|nr:DEAD/DEAH box helicase [Spirochaetia bacterium]